MRRGLSPQLIGGRRCVVMKEAVKVARVAHSMPRPRSPREKGGGRPAVKIIRSEEHTSELQSRQYLVCRPLLEKKNNVTSSSLPRHCLSFTSALPPPTSSS